MHAAQQAQDAEELRVATGGFWFLLAWGFYVSSLNEAYFLFSWNSAR